MKQSLLLFLFFAAILFIPIEAFSNANLLESSASLAWNGWTTVVLFVLIFVALVLEIRPPDVTMLIGTGFLVILGVLSPQQFLDGFSNEILIIIAMLCILMRSLEVNGVLEVIGQKILSKSKNRVIQISSITIPVALISAFLNNTAIVLLMTPLIRRWAFRQNLPLSRFLIPLSYAAILGGTCTLIGTSTNLVVYGLLHNYSQALDLSFFELGKVGVPVAIAGLIYLNFVMWRFLPDRTDPTIALTEEMREFTAEFIVDEECPFVNKSIHEMGRRHFGGSQLIQIQRDHTIIDSPGEDFMLRFHDHLVFVGDINQIAHLHAIKGLTSLQDPQFKLDITSSHFSEIVIPNASSFIGKTLKGLNFREVFGASVLAIYRRGSRVLGSVKETHLQAGDTLMLLSGEPWAGAKQISKDFHFIRHHEKLLVLNPWKAFLSIGALLFFVIAATFGYSIMTASLAAAFFALLTRTITFREAQNSIAWDILLLIACSFALGKAMEVTGAASYFAHLFLSIAGTNPHALIGSILLVTILVTEFMSNNAAALILFPIAVTAASLAGYHDLEAVKSVAIAVAMGSSCGFAIPTGYQTHMIVLGPGGYRFSDFARVGLVMNFIYLIFGTWLIPLFWPLTKQVG